MTQVQEAEKALQKMEIIEGGVYHLWFDALNGTLPVQVYDVGRNGDT